MTLTLQQVFDKTLHHLRKQGHAARTGNGTCAYRSPDGEKCAVGCHIKDEFYDPSFEGHGVAIHADISEKSDAIWSALVASGVPDSPDARVLMCKMQNAHDYELSKCSFDAWEQRMEDIATHHGLAYK